MKVAMLTTTRERCGIAAYSRTLVEVLREFVEVEIEPIEEGKRAAGYHRAQADRLNRADVVHIQHEHSFWGGALPDQTSYWTLRSMIEKPLVVTAHTTFSLEEILQVKKDFRPLHRLAKELLLRRRGYRESVDIAPFATGEECIVHTEAGRRALIGRGADPERVHTIPAGVPEPVPASTGGAAIRERFGLSGKRILSIFGFISTNKGYELTLRILPELPRDVVLVVAGGPRTPACEPYAQSLKDRVRKMGLKDRVVITGYLSEKDIAEMMMASEIVLAPHTYATGSYSVAFPLAYGRPVITSNQDCFREIHGHVPCLQLFPSGDAARFAACLKALLNDPAKRRELSELALRYAAQHPWRDVARRTAAIYEKAIAHFARPRISSAQRKQPA